MNRVLMGPRAIHRPPGKTGREEFPVRCRWICLAVALVCWACASGHEAPYDRPLPLQRDPATLARRIEALAAGCPRLTVERLGTVVYPGFAAPVHLLRYVPEGEVGRRVLVTGGLHGNEPAGVEAALRLAERICADPGRWPRTAFDVVPLVNPWGWAHHMRRNRDGRDVNRDFASFDTQEARLFRPVGDARRYDLMVDLHEDPAARGFYLYQYDRPDPALCRRIIARIGEMGFPPEREVRMIALRADDGLIDAPGWGLVYMRLTRQFSITNYLRLENGPHVFTVETPPHLSLDDRCRIHLTAVEMFVDALAR